jgi:hypothetical protein
MKTWKCPMCGSNIENEVIRINKIWITTVQWHIDKHEKDREENEKLSNTAKWKRFNEQFKR